MNASLAFDQRLWPQDVAQSRAHATMLAAPGSSRGRPRRAARRPRRRRGELARRLPVRARRRGHPHGDRAAADRDRRPVGGKLHTARSRNDQVATDVAMFTRAPRGARRARRR
jgi:argininosuccinate lyase